MTIKTYASVAVRLSPRLRITHADMCTHACTQTRNSSTLKGPKYSKDSCFDTDKGRCYSLRVDKFQNLWDPRGKYNLCSSSKEKTCFFSHLCQHSVPLSLRLALNQKGVLSVRGFQPDLSSICSTLLTLFLVWFTFVILFGLLQSDLAPTSMHVLVQQDQTEKSRNDPNGKAG